MGDKNKQNKPKKTLKEKRMEKHQKYEHTSDAVAKQTVLKSIDKSRFLQILIYIGIYRDRFLFLIKAFIKKAFSDCLQASIDA